MLYRQQQEEGTKEDFGGFGGVDDEIEDVSEEDEQELEEEEAEAEDDKARDRVKARKLNDVFDSLPDWAKELYNEAQKTRKGKTEFTNKLFVKDQKGKQCLEKYTKNQIVVCSCASYFVLLNSKTVKQ